MVRTPDFGEGQRKNSRGSSYQSILGKLGKSVGYCLKTERLLGAQESWLSVMGEKQLLKCLPLHRHRGRLTSPRA